MDDAWIYPIREYIRSRQATIAKNVVCRPIYKLCVKAERMTETIWMVIWWDQDVVNEPEESTDILRHLT